MAVERRQLYAGITNDYGRRAAAENYRESMPAEAARGKRRCLTVAAYVWSISHR